jgi:hypothetical protein
MLGCAAPPSTPTWNVSSGVRDAERAPRRSADLCYGEDSLPARGPEASRREVEPAKVRCRWPMVIVERVVQGRPGRPPWRQPRPAAPDVGPPHPQTWLSPEPGEASCPARRIDARLAPHPLCRSYCARDVSIAQRQQRHAALPPAAPLISVNAQPQAAPSRLSCRWECGRHLLSPSREPPPDGLPRALHSGSPAYPLETSRPAPKSARVRTTRPLPAVACGGSGAPTSNRVECRHALAGKEKPRGAANNKPPQ